MLVDRNQFSLLPTLAIPFGLVCCFDTSHGGEETEKLQVDCSWRHAWKLEKRLAGYRTMAIHPQRTPWRHPALTETPSHPPPYIDVLSSICNPPCDRQLPRLNWGIDFHTPR
ncbi:uncharacterized protein BDW47DRAFT_113717 [Aspergillus candidus]|uniref:Secreted protein n=1 Tax=Aspergillus candidus TaxID=41067 RepID=A0A2I2EYY1_ASPCN|nr:hypothetical protein BDW47DRAFT_113717 [Aspergillus candidus]PLB33580.1 hypothetical protein BDW47DRAFT_113717 [Aspergillus candidus]